MDKNPYVRYPLFLAILMKLDFFSTDFRKKLKYKILSKSVQWEPIFTMRTDRHAESVSRFSQFLRTRLIDFDEEKV
jgi:hypothetical protein